MTTEERVLTALRCEQPDRVPVFLYLNPYVDGWYTAEPSYAEVLEACREYADVIYDWGFPSGFFFTAAELEGKRRDLGSGTVEHVLFTPRGPISTITRPDWRGGGTIKRWITTPEDAERMLSIPYVPPRPDLRPFLETRERLRPQCVAQATFCDPICLAGWVDEATMALWTLEQRPLLRQLLDVAQERLRDQIRYCLEQGVGPIYYFNGPEYALPPLMSPRDFEEFVVEYDTPLIDLIHTYPARAEAEASALPKAEAEASALPKARVIVHSHGRVNRFLERFAALGLDGLNVLEPPPIGDVILADAKRRIGDRVCLIGNVQYDDLARGTPAQVEALVRDAIRQGGTGGGFILSPCASPYERPLPPQAAANFIHYLKMGRKYGVYPLPEVRET
jgi:uroporphyrinogen-III decarboxylase